MATLDDGGDMKKSLINASSLNTLDGEKINHTVMKFFLIN
jgi:hypothetical protein